MLATTEIVDVLDLTEELAEMIVNSEEMINYIEKKNHLKQDTHAQTVIKQFESLKEKYEDVQRFGRYHPDYNKIMKETRLKKREVDMLESVAQFKIAERSLQTLLEQVTESIAHSISPQIMVPKDGAIMTDSSCGCGSGGSCGC
ncbi:YlbF family regulator [Pelagirhabdus alkalitolerans]|uniref:YlbF family regulator n=1 Tax=Pelagirhabdus alkalitolerans TaxID=1612202 RepID=UPI000B82C74F|nr:YlbF family regulator [Pelagirhabdus alkalitolerans]